MPHDSGLSAGRNFLIEKVNTPYVLLLDDDQYACDLTDMQEWYRIFTENNFDILGSTVQDYRGHTRSFYGDIILENRKMELKLKKPISNEEFMLCDIVPNCFLARTEVLSKIKWDNQLKLAEHLDFFLRAWKQNFKIGCTPKITVMDGHKRSALYDSFRMRAQKFRAESLRKWGRKLGFDTYVVRGQTTTGDMHTTVTNVKTGKTVRKCDD
jgi:hypothetical protein